jgi:hypothetical protein
LDANVLIAVAAQFPLLVLFVIYNDRKDRQFQEFLNSQKNEYIKILDDMMRQIMEHDRMSRTHAEETRQAIALMKERVRQ